MKAWNLLVALSLVGLYAPCSRAKTTADCTVSAGGLAFGIYNPLSAVANASTGTLSVVCNGIGNGSTKVTLDVSWSTGLSASFATRKMFSGVDMLNYNIFGSTAYDQILGDGSGGSVTVSVGPFHLAGGGSDAETITMYGLVPALQDVAPGSYSDVIVVTVTY